MGIFNQQPNYNQSKGKRGITGPQGPPGPSSDNCGEVESSFSTLSQSSTSEERPSRLATEFKMSVIGSVEMFSGSGSETFVCTL